VIVVGSSESALPGEVEPLLDAARDQLVRVESDEPFTQCAAGARLARGDVLFFTESHCEADTGCLRGLLTHRRVVLVVTERDGSACEVSAVVASPSSKGADETAAQVKKLSRKAFAHQVYTSDEAQEMIKSGKGGRIINIASGAARLPTPGVGEYAVSKAGVWMLTKVLATELAEHGITANAIGPGFIKTPMTANLDQLGMVTALLDRVPMRKMGKPIDVANTALFLASEEGRYYTGSLLHPDGGIVMQ
jgi:Enoyl-(Acyl carrier protein) reductase